VPAPSLDLIRGVPLFAGLEDRYLERLAGEFMEKTFRAGENITEEGETGRTLVVIDSGAVNVFVRGQRVRQQGAGEALGEIALIDKATRSSTVTAETDVHAYLLPVWSFRPLVEEHPEMAWALLEALAQRVREVEARSSSS
jgi:CRP/FNR family cyclic AMP-dependent transcriptional regulator